MKKFLRYLLTVILTVFGLLTLFMSSSVIFDLFGIRAKEGNYVLFIVWANFICGWLFIFAAYGCFKSYKWATSILIFSEILIVLSFIGLFIHIKTGGIYETKTIGAMALRTILNLVFILISYFTINRNIPNKSQASCC